MSVSLKQFAGSTVTPSDDANLYHHLYGRSGIVTGIQATHAGTNQLSISAGWGVVYGRVFTVEAQTIGVTLTGGAAGRLKVVIDITAETPAYFESEAAATLPALVQEDLSASGNEYELSICTYTVGETAISAVVDTRVIIPINNASDKASLSGATFTGAIAGTSATFSLDVVGKRFNQDDSQYSQPNEFGKYIDMHDGGSELDYDVRIAVVDGFLVLDNPNRETTGRQQCGRILTHGTQQYITVNGSRDFELNDAGNTLIVATEVGQTTVLLTVRADADINFPIGTRIRVLKEDSSDAIAFIPASGVTFSGFTGSINMVNTNASLEKIGENLWVVNRHA